MQPSADPLFKNKQTAGGRPAFSARALARLDAIADILDLATEAVAIEEVAQKLAVSAGTARKYLGAYFQQRPAEQVKVIEFSERSATFGIGEWYGMDFAALTPSERQMIAASQLSASGTAAKECPFRPGNRRCNKEGGVCAIRLYQRRPEDVTPPKAAASLPRGELRAVCPSRFYEGMEIFRKRPTKAVLRG